MEIVNRYFEKILFKKVSNTESFADYEAVLSSFTSSTKKNIVIVHVATHLAILDEAYIDDLQWTSLQTRNLKPRVKSSAQKLDQPKIQHPMFDVTDRNERRTAYTSSEVPGLTMILLHDHKKKTINQYHNRMNLLASLMTFNCVITFNSPLTRPLSTSSKENPRVRIQDVPTERKKESTEDQEEGAEGSFVRGEGMYKAVSFQPTSTGSGYRHLTLDITPVVASDTTESRPKATLKHVIPTDPKSTGFGRRAIPHPNIMDGKKDNDDSFQLL